MKRIYKNLALIFLAFSVLSSCNTTNDNAEQSQNSTSEKNAQEHNLDEEKIKATINKLLFHAGNYNIAALDDMISDKAMLGISILRDGNWSNSEIAINDFFESVKNSGRNPYCEIPNKYDILITEGQISIARAECVLYQWGVPKTKEVNHFTFIKENEKWKILNISWTNIRLSEDKKIYDLEVFARGYAQSWNSQRPKFVSSFFAKDGKLTVNNGETAKGTNEIANVAKGFMDAFPDIVVSLDSLTTNKGKTKFHWTLTGTNKGKNGTGNKVNISGFEEWILNEDGLIQESIGYFDKKEYERQIKFGTDIK